MRQPCAKSSTSMWTLLLPAAHWTAPARHQQRNPQQTNREEQTNLSSSSSSSVCAACDSFPWHESEPSQRLSAAPPMVRVRRENKSPGQEQSGNCNLWKQAPSCWIPAKIIVSLTAWRACALRGCRWRRIPKSLHATCTLLDSFLAFVDWHLRFQAFPAPDPLTVSNHQFTYFHAVNIPVFADLDFCKQTKQPPLLEPTAPWAA